MTALIVAAGMAAGGLLTAATPAVAVAAAAAQRVCRAPAPHTVAMTGPAAAKRGPAAPPPAAVIRVDQLGFPASKPKLAEIMTASRTPSAASRAWELVIRGSCTVVAHGTASTDLGSWSKQYPAVWAVSFSRVHRPGTYRLALVSDPAVTSPWFTIGPQSSEYARALKNALSFYQNERDGPDFVRSALRSAAGHLNDANAMTFRAPNVSPNGNFRGSLRKLATGIRINATGGWFDAGDYLHFTETTSYTVAMMLQAIASFPDRVSGHGQVGFTSEAKFGLDFLQRMWNEKTKTLYIQVGTGEANNFYFADHDIWRLPQADDHYLGTNPRGLYIRHPPVFRGGKPGSRISPNLAGRLAADFALCYRVFRRSDPNYAVGCLRSAETVYALAGTHWKGQLQTVLPFGFYPESSWRDDMMLGATELALALHVASAGHTVPGGLPVSSATTYLGDAAHWARVWIGGKSDNTDTLNLYDVSSLAEYELYRAIHVVQPGHKATGGSARPPHLAITRPALLGDLRAQIQRAIGIAGHDPFGYGFAWDQFDTTTHGLGLSVMANEYDELTGRPTYAAWGQRWLDDVLGSNSWGVSLIVGDGTIFPDCMQHQITNLIGSTNGSPPVLAGAVVEGPNSFAATGVVQNMKLCKANAPGNVPYAAFNGHHAVFADNVQSYSTVEPAIDLTSVSPLAFAWQEAGAQGGY